MSITRRTLLAVCLTVSFACSRAAAPAGASTLPYIPLDHWATPLISEAIGRGLLTQISLSDQPYQRAAVARALRRAHALSDSTQRSWSPFEAWLVRRIEEEVSASEPAPTPALSRLTSDWLFGYGLEARADALTGVDHRPLGKRDGKGILLPYVGFQSGRGLAAGIRFRMDTDGSRVPDFNGRPWRHGWTGDTKNAYALLQLGKAEVLLGRDDLRWGPSDTPSLLLSANSAAFDQVGLRIQVGPITASSFFANLDDMKLAQPFAQAVGDTLAAGTVLQRHLSGHRIRWQASPSFALGVAEVVVYGGVDRPLEPEYIIPVSIYYAGQWNSDKNDNSFIDLTAELRPKPDMEIYGELLVDDYQFEHKTRADEEPFEGGYLLGQRIHNPLGLDGSTFRLEWAHVMPFTYNQVFPWNRYLYKGRQIGFPLGPDAQALDVEYRHWMSEQLTWTIQYRREERGETRVTDAWPIPITGPDSLNAFPRFDHIPTGTVESRSKYSTEFWVHPQAGLDVRLGGGYALVKNLDNVKDRTRVEWFFQGSVHINWSRWLAPSEGWTEGGR